MVDCFDNLESRSLLQVFARPRGKALVHTGLAGDGRFGLVRWTERFAPDAEDEPGQATCEGGEHLPAAFPESRPMHEFVMSGAPMKRALGITTTDLAKRLLDYGYHPPTVYFPLLVQEALLVEPTETETRETLDGFAEAIGAILREAAEDPSIAQNAPYTTPVRRLDQAASARKPVVRQALD